MDQKVRKSIMCQLNPCVVHAISARYKIYDILCLEKIQAIKIATISKMAIIGNAKG